MINSPRAIFKLLTKIQLLFTVCNYRQIFPQSIGDQSATYVIAAETPEQHG
jgi:hypothetical protein